MIRDAKDFIVVKYNKKYTVLMKMHEKQYR